MPFRISRYQRYLVCLILCLTWSASAFAFQDTGSLIGSVLDAESGSPLPGANVYLEGTTVGAVSAADGQFEISNVSPGTYTVIASMLGFEPIRRPDVTITSGQSQELRFQLAEKTTSLRDIVVTPGRFSIGQGEVIAAQQLTQGEMRTVPQVGEDVYRAVTRLPGLSGNDFSSRFTVRGGGHDEVLVTLDGLKLYEPFHLKDVNGGALSAIDIEAIGGIDMMTGGFPAQYGDRLSGVFNISSSTAGRERSRTSVGISFLNARFLTEGTFADGKGDYFLLGRRGYMDLVLGFVDDDGGLKPLFYDGFAKLRYRMGKHTLSLQSLISDDSMTAVDAEDPNDVADTGYWNRYAWANLTSVWSPRLYSQTVISTGVVGEDRFGMEVAKSDDSIDFRVRAKDSFKFVGIKQDWSWDFADWAMASWGAEFRDLNATYDADLLKRTSVRWLGDQSFSEYDSTRNVLGRDGQEISAYFSQKVRATETLTLEAGIRYDRMSWSGDDVWSPRLNLAWAIDKRTVLRAGWGHFHQAQGIHELDVLDGDTEFHPAQRSEHRILGLERQIGTGTTIRADVYQKRIDNPRPRYMNLWDDIDFFPESSPDRTLLRPTRGEARGLELYAKKSNGSRFNWAASYGLSYAYDEIDGLEVPKSFDQRHTLYLDGSWSPSPKWRLTAAWQYHSGWAYTPSTLSIEIGPDGAIAENEVFGPINSAQYPAYHRLDVRMNRDFQLGSGKLAVFLEARNVYNRSNVASYDFYLDETAPGEFTQLSETENWFPIMPSFGVRWDIFH